MGCNAILGIEEQGPRAATEVTDAGPVAPEGGPREILCTTDSECVPPNGCYTGRCDAVTSACVFTICESKTAACRASRCLESTKTCDPSAERAVAFKTTGYLVPDVTMGNTTDPLAGVAAVYPFVFVGTKAGVAAIAVDDLLSTSPRVVPVRGFDLPAVRVVASGRRLWLLGAVQGAAPPYRVPIGWIDVPADPTKASLDASLTTFAYSFPTIEAFAAPGGGLYVAHGSAAEGLPAAALSPPLPREGVLGLAGNVPPDGGAVTPSLPNPTHTMFRAPNAAPGSVLVASSGARLVAYRYSAVFNLVDRPGSEEATFSADSVLMPIPTAIGSPRFGQGPDGSVAFSIPSNLPPPECNCVSQARVAWLLPDGNATAVEANQGLPYESWTNPMSGGCRVCSFFVTPSLVTWIDRSSLLVAAPASEALRAQTAVRLASRSPLAAPTTKRFVTNPAEKGDFMVHKIALTSSAGFGYLVVATAEGNDVAVSIFDPRCESAP